MEGHPNIKFATSIVDYIFRVLGVEYLKRYDFAQVKPAEAPVAIEDPTDRALVPAPSRCAAAQPLAAAVRTRPKRTPSRTARSTRSSKR